MIAVFNAITGQATYLQRNRTTRTTIARFWTLLEITYPSVDIDVVVDNWLIHFHVDVLAPLQPQYFPWPSNIRLTSLKKPSL